MARKLLGSPAWGFDNDDSRMGYRMRPCLGKEAGLFFVSSRTGESREAGCVLEERGRLEPDDFLCGNGVAIEEMDDAAAHSIL